MEKSHSLQCKYYANIGVMVREGKGEGREGKGKLWRTLQIFRQHNAPIWKVKDRPK